MVPRMPAIAERKERKQTVADFMALGEGPPFAELIHQIAAGRLRHELVFAIEGPRHDLDGM